MEQLSRKDQILQALAIMLEAEPDARITTKGLAEKVGVSEAALYRHFPSKTRMFEGLIEFADQAVASRIGAIEAADNPTLIKIGQVLQLVLLFAERNPGIARLLMGGALSGEHERLHRQVAQFFDRLESRIKQLLRQAEIKEQLRTNIPVGLTANLLVATLRGLILQYVHSGFAAKPSEGWSAQWELLQTIVFRNT